MVFPHYFQAVLPHHLCTSNKGGHHSPLPVPCLPPEAHPEVPLSVPPLHCRLTLGFPGSSQILQSNHDACHPSIPTAPAPGKLATLNPEHFFFLIQTPASLTHTLLWKSAHLLNLRYFKLAIPLYFFFQLQNP